MSELIKRILTGSVLAGFTRFLMFKSPIGFAVFIVTGGLITGYEFAKLSKMQADSFWILFVILMPYALLLWASNGAMLVAFIPLLVISSLIFWLKNVFLVVGYPNIKPSDNASNKAISMLLLITPMLVVLPLLQREVPLLLLLLLIVWGADSFAYFSGKAFGKHKLAPNLSAGKTVEGVIGGLLGVLIITGIWMFVADYLDWRYLPLALVTGIFSIVGDLYESIYKREAGAKDSGKSLPGHGGMFDRLDGVLAATPIFGAGLFFI
jgi:phosphatidate cytidylyltransferase